MRIFVTGGSGQTGPAVVRELVSGGHQVLGLARSDEAAARLQALGAETVRGSLTDLDALSDGAAACDGVVHMAFGGSFNDPEQISRRDVEAIEALGTPLVGTGNPLVMTSGTFAMAADAVSVETDEPDPDSLAHFRIPGEQACLALADDGVRSVVLRLAPTVHGPQDHGFVPALVAAARRNGVSMYVGDGANRWPAVHRLDAAALFRLAVESAPAGTAMHGADESGVTLRAVADRIGRSLGVPTVSMTLDQATAHLDNAFLALAFATDAPASSALTRTLLGWTPAHPTLLEDLETGDYL